MRGGRQGANGERELVAPRDMGTLIVRREGRRHTMVLLAMLHRQVAMVGSEEGIMGPGSQEDQRQLRTTAKMTVTTKQDIGSLKSS